MICLCFCLDRPDEFWWAVYLREALSPHCKQTKDAWEEAAYPVCRWTVGELTQFMKYYSIDQILISEGVNVSTGSYNPQLLYNNNIQ